MPTAASAWVIHHISWVVDRSAASQFVHQDHHAAWAVEHTRHASCSDLQRMKLLTTRWGKNWILGTLLFAGVALGCSSEGGAVDDDGPGGSGSDETGGVSGSSTGGTISGGSGTPTGGTAGAGAMSGSGGTSGGTAGAAGAAGVPSSGGGGTGGRGGEGGAAGLAAGGRAGSAGASGSAGAPGTSIYGEPCDDEGDSCGRLGVSCLEVSFGGGAISALTCSNTCPGGVDECDDPPAGSGMAVACLPFTTADRCVLVCDVNGTEYPCPTGMSCVGDGGSPVRLCVWL